jgi:hypothetical protein
MKRMTLAAITGMAFATLSANTSAENGHTYNGSQCNSFYGSQAGGFDRYGNGIVNKTGSHSLVICPVTVDEVDKTTGTTQIWVHYTGTGTPSCTFMSMNGNGTVRQSKSGFRTNTGWMTIPNITSDDFWGSYSMYCGLPPNGVLNTVWVGEKN